MGGFEITKQSWSSMQIMEKPPC